MNKLLVINPGSTSTKIGVYLGNEKQWEETIRHTSEEIGQFKRVADQQDYRKDLILNVVKDKGEDLKDFSAIVGRGGLVAPIPSGVYKVCDNLKKDLITPPNGEHASNLGGLIALEIANSISKEAFIVDPVVVDELQDVARLSGHKKYERKSIFHALNQKAANRRYCKENNVKATDINLIIAHLGGGISVGAHLKGQVVDVNNALDGEGAFSPERSGNLPMGAIIKDIEAKNITTQEAYKMVVGKGGLMSYNGTNDMIALGTSFDNKEEDGIIFEAMAYQVAKDIGAYATVLKGKVDAIILTGGIAYSKSFVKLVTERIEFLGKVVVYPGEDELLALAEAVDNALNGNEEIKSYKK